MQRARHPQSNARAFTLVELLVVIGIIAVLISILLPSLSKARKAAAGAKCLSNLKQLVIATQMYVNDNDGYLPYCGTGDSHSGRKGTTPGTYAANWLYDPKQLATPGSGTSFVPNDAKTGAIWQYLDGKLNVLCCPLADQNEADHKSFAYICTYVMNGNLGNYPFDGTGNFRPQHKRTEFPGVCVAYWDWPATGSIGSGGASESNGAKKIDPSSNGTDWPATSGRHTNLKSIPTDNNFYTSVTGGLPVSFLDGHAEIWPIYVFHDNLNTNGPPNGNSMLWVAPGDPKGNGGYGGQSYTMTEVIGTN